MAYFFIYLLIIIVNIFAVLFVLKIRRNRLNDADVITDATLVEEDSIQQVRTKKSFSLFNKQDPSTNIFVEYEEIEEEGEDGDCLLYTSPSPRDATLSRMPSSA